MEIEFLSAITLPVFDPYVFSFQAPWGGTIGVRWYSLSYIAGIFFGWWWIQYLLKQKHLWANNKTPFNPNIADEFLFSIFLGVLVGGRLGYVIFYNPIHFLYNPLEIFYIWQGGMSFHGGFAGVLVASYMEARMRSISWANMLDLLAACTPVGLLLGRIANFINGELYGRVTNVAWGMVFPYGGSLPRHPSQLYEAALEGLLLMVIISLAIFKFNALKKPFLASGIFCAGYGLSRFTVEFFREPDQQLGYFFGGATMGMILSLPLIITGILLITHSLKQKN